MRAGGISTALLTFGGILFLTAVFLGIGIAIILSLIPSYLSTRSLTPTGEKYCINNLLLNLTINTTGLGSTFTNLTITNTSYSLSEACYRILQNSKSDSLLTACLLSKCTLGSTVSPGTVVVATNLTCTAVIYYETRCPGTSTVSNTTTSNNTCRKQRVTNINKALGSTPIVQFTNVVSLIFDSIVVAIQSLYTYPFSSYSQTGAYYCGDISRTSITSAVSAQATG